MAYQLNAKHDGHMTDPLFISLPSLQWSKDLVGPVQYPLIVGSEVFVDVGHVDQFGDYAYGSSVSAYDLNSGSLVWGPVDIGGTYQFGALAYENDRVFALNEDGELYALDVATGAMQWKAQLAGDITSPPTAHDGVVYTSGGGLVFAVAEATGTIVWTAPVENGDSSSPAVNQKGVFVSYTCEQAYRFSSAGEQRWHHSTGCEGGGGRTDVLHGHRVYIRDQVGRQPAVLSQKTGYARGSFASDVAPAFTGKTMVTLVGGAVSAIDLSTDAVLWTRDDARYDTAPLIVNDYVVEGDGKGLVHVIRLADGVQVWTGDAGAPILPPNEQSGGGLTGLAEANGYLAVPAGSTLSIFASAA